MKLIIKLIERMTCMNKNNIAKLVNDMLPEPEPFVEIEIENPFEPHEELIICSMTGEILLEESYGFIPVTLIEITPTYAVFKRPDGSRLGRNLKYCDDIWLQYSA